MDRQRPSIDALLAAILDSHALENPLGCDAETVAARVTGALRRLGQPARTVTATGWLNPAPLSCLTGLRPDGNMIGFVHHVTVCEDRVLDGTARQFDPELPPSWVSSVADYPSLLAARVERVSHVTLDELPGTGLGVDSADTTDPVPFVVPVGELGEQPAHWDEERTPVPPVASDGEVRVCDDMCDTCVFRPGNLKKLRPGRLAQMIRDALDNEGHIVCHNTLRLDRGAICRGFADHPHARERSFALRVADALGVRVEIAPPPSPEATHRGSGSATSAAAQTRPLPQRW